MNILVSFGTRPEWIKIKPLLDAFKKYGINYKCLFTGQHRDLLKEHTFDYSLSIPETTNNRLSTIVARILEYDIPWSLWDYVLTQGDTASAYAMSLAAYNNKTKVIHLEAGLRSYDLNNPYPEEAFRQMISRIASINLCPTELSCNQLKAERVSGLIYNVGNTVLDNLIDIKSKCKYTNIILVTLHRRENHLIIKEWFTYLNIIASLFNELKFIFPVHPNPNIKDNIHLLSNLQCIDPLDYGLMKDFISKCKFIITDSGGLQEEGTFLNKKVIVCRKTTERPEGIDTGHLFLCPNPKELLDIVDSVNRDPFINSECPYGDGNSAEKICKILNSEKFD